MYFSDISVYQIPSYFRPKYTNLHQSYTNLAKLLLSPLKSHIWHSFSNSFPPKQSHICFFELSRNYAIRYNFGFFLFGISLFRPWNKYFCTFLSVWALAWGGWYMEGLLQKPLRNLENRIHRQSDTFPVIRAEAVDAPRPPERKRATTSIRQ